MEIIVGSTALEKFGMERSTSKDLDIWLSVGETTNLKGDISYIPQNIMLVIPTIMGYATPNAIYTIKCSHLGWPNPMWEKHKTDVLWLKSKGCTIIPELYDKLLDFWKVELSDKSFLSLDNTKEKFFDDNVNYIYDHDYLHELVSYPNRPMYESVLKENNQVMVDKGKFDMLTFDNQVRMFREEITVIACERWVCNPYWGGKVSWCKAYQLSLRKTITSLTKGWATNFIVENLEEFIKPDFSYFKYLLKTLDNGRYNMSEVDLSVFEELAEMSGDSVESVVYELCEGDFSFGCGYEWENKYPEYSLRTSNPEEYEKLLKLYDLERKTKYKDYVSSQKAKYGYEHLEQDGGGEGGSEDCYGVFKLNGKIYKAEYQYYSYNGHEYDNILYTLGEVTPKEKTITVYE